MHVFAAFAPALLLAASATYAVEPALSLGEAQRIAAREAPVLGAQEAAVRAAREASVAAGELPDPRLIASVENLPLDGEDRFSLTRDFMTMRKIGVMQDFVRAEKRELKTVRAQAEADKEAAVLSATGANVRRDVAIAWIDAWLAERQQVLLKELEGEASLASDAARAALAGGRGQASEPFTAQLAEEQLRDRTIEARRAIARSRAVLARWVGETALRPLAEAPDFTRLAHQHASLLADLETHPHLAMYAPMRAVADAEVRLAEAAKHPDWSLEVTYAQRGPAYSNMVSIGVRIDLPLFEGRRQNPAIASKLAAAEQVRAQAEDARRAHVADLQIWLADWQAASERAQRLESAQLPLARERAQAALADYRGGKGDLAAVLDARRAEIEIRLMHLQAVGDMARSWAQLNFVLPVQGEERR